MKKMNIESGKSLEMLTAWGIEPKEVHLVRGVMRVAAKDGRIYGVKELKERPERFRRILAAMEHGRKRGFLWMPESIPTRAGEELHWDEEGRVWHATSWVIGREPRYRFPGEMGLCAEAVALWHWASCGGWQSGEASIKNKAVRWRRRVEKRIVFLEAALEHPGFGSEDRFHRLFQAKADWYRQKLTQTRELLAQVDSMSLVESWNEAPVLCHGDTAARNFVLSEGRAWLIDFDSLAADLPLIEIWRLFRRTLRKSGWDDETARTMITAYERHRPLSREEKFCLYALLHFPEKEWRLAKQHYDRRQEEYEGESLIKNLAEYNVQHEAIDRFLAGYPRLMGL